MADRQPRPDTPERPDTGDKTAPGPLRRTLRLVRPHLRSRRGLMAAGIAVLLLEVAFRVLEPWPVKFVIDAVTRSLGADVSGAPASVELLAACALATIAIIGFRALCNYLGTVAFALVGSRVATDLRQRVFGHVQRLPDQFHKNNRSGDTVQRLVGDVGRLQEVAVTAGLPLAVNVITLLVMTVVMLVLDPLLACVVVISVVLFALLSRGSSGRITQASRKTRKGEGQLANTAQETLGAIRVVQAYGLESEVAGRFARSNEQSLTEGVQARRLAAGLERRTDVLVGLATAAVLYLGAQSVLRHEMTPGDLVIFLTYLKTAMKPMRDLAKYTGRVARAAASGERVAGLLEEPVTIADPEHPVPLDRARGALSFQAVTSGYGDRDVLHDIDLQIDAGERVALIGESGSGKSTLASLLVRTLDPRLGSVSLDGVDVRRHRLEDLRRNVAMVWQDTVLFSGTIADKSATVTWPPTTTNCAAPPDWPTHTTSSNASPTATKRSWGSGARPSPVGSGSGWRWPAPCCGMRPSSCSTRRRPGSTRRVPAPFSTRSMTSPRIAPSS